MFCAMKRKHGKAKHWPVDAEIFAGEVEKFWKRGRDMGWTQDHIPIWCLDAIDARAKQGGGNYTKPPPRRLLPSDQLKVNTKKKRRGRLDVLVYLLYWPQVYRRRPHTRMEHKARIPGRSFPQRPNLVPNQMQEAGERQIL